ncbi:MULTISPECIES: sensor histidine kinase [unclassified Streptomyces]|uniref:sensor histidine kinase n=1 Tax=unclassified Streptomyces TaxID=2593676 RepID=UPI0009A0C796|nr:MULTISPECIES: histidine kinase [unclassified Streptomyces]
MSSHDRSDRADESGGGRRAVAPPASGGSPSAPRSAHTILIGALLGFALLTAADILSAGLAPAVEATCLLVLLAVLALQLLHSVPGGAQVPLPRRCLTLAGQAALTCLPFLLFHTYWATMAGYLAASLLLLLPAPVGWPLYGAVGLGPLVLPVLDGRPPAEGLDSARTLLLTGFVLYGLTRLTELVTRLHATRGELARQAVTGERLRFARDLHDLLGHSLSAITLKSELAHRLIPVHPARALQEVGEVLSIAEQSLADVRKVVSGFRDLSLRQEINTARSMLDAAGIDVRAEVELGSLSPHVDTALATTLREAVTNLLRHSNASRCCIEAVQLDCLVRLVIMNDGVDSVRRAPSPYGGNGLGNLHARVTALGGRLESGPWQEGTFRLLAEVPAQRSCPTARTGG